MNDHFYFKKAGPDILVCRPFEDQGFLGAFSTRSDGNMAFPNDDKSAVQNRRRRFLDRLAQQNKSFFAVRQVHSAICVDITSRSSVSEEQTEADALLSADPNVVLAVKTADCLPLLIADPETGTMAALHAGWRGARGGIIESALDRLRNGYHVKADSCLAALGPSACGDCYEVGEEVAVQFKSARKKPGSEKWTLDIPQYALSILLGNGFKRERVYDSGYCPLHHNDLFYSHRKDADRPAGRFLSIVGRI